MRHERLARLIQARRTAMIADRERALAHETMVRIFTALDKREVTEGQALRFLGFQATRVPDKPGHAALYRQAAADIRQMRA